MFKSILNMRLFKESDDFNTDDGNNMDDLNNELNSSQDSSNDNTNTDNTADTSITNYSDESGDEEPLIKDGGDNFEEGAEFGGDSGDDIDALNADLQVQDQDNNFDLDSEDVNDTEVENDNISKTKNTVIEIHKSLVNMYNEYSDFIDNYKKLDININIKSVLEDPIEKITDLLETLKVYIQSSEDEPVLKIKKIVEFRCLFVHEFNKISSIVLNKNNNV